MQLDQTQIAIRERDISELFDLALHVFRRYFKPLMVAIVFGYLPIGLMNWWLCKPLLQFIPADSSVSGDAISKNVSLAYLSQMCLLFFITQPLASVPITLYLGQSLFTKQSNIPKMFKDFLKMLPQIVWYGFVLRGIAILWLLWWGFPPSEMDSDGGITFLVFMIVMITMIVTAVRPFMMEIILLEQNPYSATKRSPMTTSKRNKMLHSMHSGTLVWRFIAASMYTSLLLFALSSAVVFIYQFQLQEHLDFFTLQIATPIGLSLIAGFLAMVRFLGYLDLRIRNEGWEVELLMRAEGARLEQQLI